MAKKFTEKQVSVFWRMLNDGILEHLDNDMCCDGLDLLADKLAELNEGQYFRQAMSHEMCVTMADEAGELTELANKCLTTWSKSARPESKREVLDDVAKNLGIDLYAPLDLGDVNTRKRITSMLGLQWYATNEQIINELKTWL